MTGSRSFSTRRFVSSLIAVIIASGATGDTPVRAHSPRGNQTILVTETQVTSSPNPSEVGETVTIAAVVSSLSGDPIPGGRVRFDVDGAMFFANVDVEPDGTAQFTTVALAPGPHEIFAMYSGYQPAENDGLPDAQPSSVEVGHVVLFPTTTTLTSSVNPSMVGDSVTFSVEVTGNGGPAAGDVTFLAGSNPLGTVTLDGNGGASFTTSDLPAGVHTITAHYAGNATLAPSSSTLSQQVDALPTTTSTTSTTTTSTTTPSTTTTTTTTTTPTTTTTTTPEAPATVTRVSSSANPSVVGQAVTFTVTITIEGPSGFRSARRPRQVDGGTLTLTDDGTVLGVLPLIDGRASLTTTGLSVGTHTITATFSGSATAAPSAATIVQQVDPAPPTILPPTR